ncbi:pumilio homolog 2 [Triticum aestivum]|nr:pumilio homolog 2-like [Triticum aestivum]
MTLEQLLMSRSALVVQLLEQVDEEIRRRVLGWFVHRAHEIMGNRQGHAEFATLLRICRWRHEELRSIVEAAITPNLVSRSNDGVTSLKMLIAEVARHWDLSERLVGSFVNERVMDEPGGNELIAHCFTTMPYEATKALIRHALDTINDKLESEFGSRCLAVCFRNARADELKDFEKVVCEDAIAMAMGQYSNYFMQGVLEHGDIGVQYAVVDQLMTEVASLCCHRYGHYVLQSCILKTGDYRGELLRRLIQELERLGDTQLAGLVKNRFGSRVLSRLLDTAETPRFRNERWGWELAQRIRRASAAHLGPDLEKTNAKRVMKSVDRMGL